MIVFAALAAMVPWRKDTSLEDPEPASRDAEEVA